MEYVKRKGCLKVDLQKEEALRMGSCGLGKEYEPFGL
jgi:hypothetical protein